MIDLELPLELSAEPPDFNSVESARDWLEQLPLANTTQAQEVLARQLELLAGTALSLDQRLRIIEVLREPVLLVQQECLRRFAARALPLSTAEQQAYGACLGLWRVLETNYLLCLQNSLAGQLPDQAALAAQRAVTAKTGELLAHCAAGYLVPPAYWSRLHQIYRAGEVLQVSMRTVADELNANTETTLAAAYVEPLLLAAAQPLELTPRQLDLVARWARRWAAKVSVLATEPREAKTPPLLVNLASACALAARAMAQPEADWRWLELTELRKTLKRRVQGLASGESPESLQLGSDCVQPDCGELLLRIYRLWCKSSGATLKEARASADCELAAGFVAMHFFLSGKIFVQPEATSRLSKREHEEIATFGNVISRHREESRQQFSTENWQARTLGAADMQLSRSLQQYGARIARGQLLAIRPQGASGFMLGVVRSLIMDGEEGQFRVNVRLLAGTPSAVALRCTGVAVGADSFSQGFRLPALEQLQEPASVLMPSGYFRPGRIIEIYTDVLRQVRLVRLLERGTDFERASFEWE